MRSGIAALALWLLATAAHAQGGLYAPPAPVQPYSFASDPTAQAAIAGLEEQIPVPSSATPNSPAPTPSSGSSSTYLRGDTTIAALCRRTTTTTASDGSFSVSWVTPLNSAMPWGHVEPIYTGSVMPPVCWMRSISATGIAGQCSPTQTTAVSLAGVTAGLTLSPFAPNTGAAGLTVKVSACEPTQ